MGARTYGLVWAALPVGEVVAALVTGARPVGYLVATPPVRGQKLERELVLVGGPIVVLLSADPLTPLESAGGCREMVASLAGESLGAGVVERQGVQREVVGAERERPSKGALPSRHGLVGHVIEKVQAQGREAGGAGLGHRHRAV